jgi:hypothetical protein
MTDRMIEIDYAVLGARLADEDAKLQAQFFHGLARELASWPSHFEQEVQFGSIARLLSKEDRGILANVCAMFQDETP